MEGGAKLIVSRTPHRISFFGGGTDLPSFYRGHGGEVISTTIDKYVTVKVFDADEYGDTGIVFDALDEQTHRIISECLQESGVSDVALEVESDCHPRSGLGGSSAFTVGMLTALVAYKSQMTPYKEFVAASACQIEIEKLGSPIGKQDQYAASYGGFNRIYFNQDETVKIEPIAAPLSELEDSLMLFYTGVQRDANAVMPGWHHSDNAQTFLKMCEQVDYFHRYLIDGDFVKIGLLLDQAWQLKKSLTMGVSSPLLDEIYSRATQAGAWGGKLLGAGGGGHFLFIAPEERHGTIIEALRDHATHVPFKFESKGSHIVE